MNIHLIDGTYELFRNHFGAPPKKAPDGREVGATLGLLRSLSMLLTSPNVTHVGVAFDHVIESFRNDLFAGYKTGEGVDPKLLEQFSLAEEVVSALGVVVWSMVEFEADDAIASAVKRFKKNKSVEQIIIGSPDKDLDGYPGIPGWGAKSASTVLSHFEHLERIPEDAEKWKLNTISPGRAASLSQSLASHRQEALLYRKLATLHEEVPIQEKLSDLKWQGAFPRLKELCLELGDEKIPMRITRWR